MTIPKTNYIRNFPSEESKGDAILVDLEQIFTPETTKLQSPNLNKVNIFKEEEPAVDEPVKMNQVVARKLNFSPNDEVRNISSNKRMSNK